MSRGVGEVGFSRPITHKDVAARVVANYTGMELFMSTPFEIIKQRAQSAMIYWLEYADKNKIPRTRARKLFIDALRRYFKSEMKSALDNLISECM